MRNEGESTLEVCDARLEWHDTNQFKLLLYQMSASPCHKMSNSINYFLMVIFVLLQVFVIFAYPRLNFVSHQVLYLFF